MSQSTTQITDEPGDELTTNERELFDRLADKCQDETTGRILELIAQSSDKEVSNS